MEEAMIVLVGKDLGDGRVEVTVSEFRRVSALPSVVAGVPGVPRLSEERGNRRSLCGTPMSMGGLRLPKKIVIRDEDSFVVKSLTPVPNMVGILKDGTNTAVYSELVTAQPEDLFPVSINNEGLATAHSNYNQEMFGFKVPKNADVGALLLGYGSRERSIQHLLGHTQDAVVMDADGKAEFMWVVLEPLVVPSPKSRFPSAEGK